VTLGVYAVCLSNPPPGAAVTEQAQTFSVPAQTSSDQEVSCQTPGQVAVGGGFSASQMLIYRLHPWVVSPPDPTTWWVEVYNPTKGTLPFTAYVECLAASGAQVSVQQGANVLTQPASTATNTASCSQGTFRAGGGFQDAADYAYSSYPSDATSSWEADDYNAQGAGAGVDAFNILVDCLSFAPVGPSSQSCTLAGTIADYPLQTPNSWPFDITAGPDGNLWFTESNGNSIGEITPTGTIAEHPLPHLGSKPIGITTGPDGNLWFTEHDGNRIGRITPQGAIAEFPLPTPGSGPGYITVGPSGTAASTSSLWFTEEDGNRIGRISPTGTIKEFPPLPSPGSAPLGITLGADGNLWFTEFLGTRIGHITPTGTISEDTLPAPGGLPRDITQGADGNLWFTDAARPRIWQMTPSGTFLWYPLPPATASTSKTFAIAPGPDDSLLFTENTTLGLGVTAGGRIGQITATGAITEYPLASAYMDPSGITMGPNCTVWFTEPGGNRIGELT
jgi:streptogramin lyase